MQRIKSTDDAVLDGSGNYIFADSNPPALDTIITADWLNSIQEEISAVVELSGQYLDDSKYNQLVEGIKRNHAFTANDTITFGIGGTFSTLKLAIDSLQGRYIYPGVTVTLEMMDGVHEINTPLYFTHPQGDQVKIVGSNAGYFLINATTWAREDAALTFKNGGKIKLLSNCYFFFDVAHPVTVPVFAVKVQQGSSVGMDLDTRAYKFHAAFVAEDGGVITATSCSSTNIDVTGLTGVDATTYGVAFLARRGGVIKAKSCLPRFSSAFGFLAESGGILNLDSCISDKGSIGARLGGVLYANASQVKGDGLGLMGFQSLKGSTVNLKGCTSGGFGMSVDYGYYSADSSSMTCESCTAVDSDTANFIATNSSLMTLKSCTSTDAVYGIAAEFGSSLSAVSCASNTNQYGYHASAGSKIMGSGNTGTGNITALKYPASPDTTTFSIVIL